MGRNARLYQTDYRPTFPDALAAKVFMVQVWYHRHFIRGSKARPVTEDVNE